MAFYRTTALLAVCLSAAACNPQEPASPPASRAPAATTPAVATAPLTVVNWGQRSTQAGEPFNVQADGNSGISFELSRPAPAGEFSISFDGKPLTGVVVNELIITATIPSALLTEAGTYPVVVENASQGLRIEAGDFAVEAP